MFANHVFLALKIAVERGASNLGLVTDLTDRNLIDILDGSKSGRECDDEFIYFNAVGLAYTDISIAYAMYQKAVAAGVGTMTYLQENMIFEKDLTGKIIL